MKEFVRFLPLILLVKARLFMEWVRSLKYYAQNRTFFQADLLLILFYFFRNPYVISKQFLKKKGAKEVHAYGETYYSALEKIVKECRITAEDTLFELGCGRGKALFWLSTIVGCKVVGIEQIPVFVEKAKKISELLEIDNFEILQEDMLESDFSEATVIYFYGTNFDRETIKGLITKFLKLPVGTKIITVSYPLTDYTKSRRFVVERVIPISFAWGIAEVYLHRLN